MKVIVLMVAVLTLLIGCSEQGEDQPLQETVFDAQIKAVDKAEQAVEQMEDAIEKQRQAIESQQQ